MPAAFVLDASAVAKLFREERESEAFRGWYLQRRGEAASFTAPSLLAFELGELIRGREKGSPDQRASILEAALSGIELQDEALLETFRAAQALTFYDASYVSLALRVGATLATYDDKIRAAAPRLGLKVEAPGR